MKLASKFIAALAVMASFSSFAAPFESVDLAAADSIDKAIELSGLAAPNTSTAAIFQVTASNAFISQTGNNSAAIIQNVTGTAAIMQTEAGNQGVIYQE